ncbi:MAG: phosphate signaling complex protein PhoU [Candidatus Omnitrophica bacterium]|nr:phosphate signaling complex protein PhoU [Candidatus Omnitrophota bacterium]
MERHFDQELGDLKKDLLKIAALAEEAIRRSVGALKNNDRLMAKHVIEEDARIDALELSIDEKCIDLIARHQPMARDLRFITSAMKINAELERIADLAVDISQRVFELADKPLLKPLEDIPKLTMVAQRMVRMAIDAFVKEDSVLALEVLKEDCEADALRNSIQDELVNDFMAKDGSAAPRAVPLLLIARHLERICDHATNIAEDVIYIIEAETVKHRRKVS